MAAETPSPASKEKTGGDAPKDGQGNFNDWAAAMQAAQAAQAFYKGGPPGAAHPGGYYAPAMAPPPHPYMWGAQPMMSPYGGPAPSPYYGAMYPQQHPMSHPPPASYAYAAPIAKEGSEAPVTGSAPAANPSNAPDGSNTEGNSSGNSEERSRSGGAIGTDVTTLPFQDEREVKRQRRKQSNRESARRSRLRKQAECEDLGSRVANLVAENNSMHTEVTRLQERCARLTAENAALVEQAKAAGLMVVDFSGPHAASKAGPVPVATAVIVPEGQVTVEVPSAASEEVSKLPEALVVGPETILAMDLKTETPAESLQSVVTSQVLVPA